MGNLHLKSSRTGVANAAPDGRSLFVNKELGSNIESTAEEVMLTYGNLRKKDEERMADRSLLLILILAWLAGCTASSSGPPETSIPVEDQYIEEYLIGIGDTLIVDVYRHQDVSTSVTVRPDGKVTIPVAGEIFVGSRRPEAVAEIIKDRLAEYIRDPIVTVTVGGTGSEEYVNRVRITGAVASPSSMPFRTGMTVLDVVLEAGGPTDFAATSKAVIYRKGSGRLRVRLDRILQSGDMATNYQLKPGDVITVPERIF